MVSNGWVGLDEPDILKFSTVYAVLVLSEGDGARRRAGARRADLAMIDALSVALGIRERHTVHILWRVVSIAIITY